MASATWLIKDCLAFLPEQGFCARMGIVLRAGRIVSVGRDLKGPQGAKVFDAQGAWTTAGLVDGHTHMGLKDHPFNDGDVNEKSDPVTPYVQAIDAINPFNEVFAQALLSGVTTVMTLPGSTNVLGGLGALIKTYGTVVDRMALQPAAAMKMALGTNPKNAFGARNQIPFTRMGSAYLLRNTFDRALEYRRRRAQRGGRTPLDRGLENVLQVLSGQLPARIHCHRADDIMTALRLADEFGFQPCLDHATDGHLVVEELVRRDTPCFCGPNLGPPAKPENARKGYGNAVKLRQAGVRVALVSDHGVDPCWYLPVYAGLAVREGMMEDDALCAITAWPADIMGVGHRVGSLAKGRDADVVIWDRHPLFMGKPVRVYAAGQPVTETALPGGVWPRPL